MLSDTELIGRLSEKLTRSGYRMATAESCTGGMIGAWCTALAGSSLWFGGGIIAYANEVKEQVLGVPATVLAVHGAVSEAVVRHMAFGALRVCGVQAAVAVSGVAGPGGGSAEKPVGTVWTASALILQPGSPLPAADGESPLTLGGAPVTVRAAHHLFTGDRNAVREQAARQALVGLLEHITGAIAL